MTVCKTLTLLALTAVLATPVMAFAQADDMQGPGPMRMFDFDLIDANKDGKITTAEFDAFRAAEFAKADTNADGLVNAQELAAKQMADMAARAEDMAGKMIERMDGNADGQLSADEMAQGPRAPTLFERADADDDGAVSKDEMEAMQSKMKGHGKHHRKG